MQYAALRSGSSALYYTTHERQDAYSSFHCKRLVLSFVLISLVQLATEVAFKFGAPADGKPTQNSVVAFGPDALFCRLANGLAAEQK